MRMRNSTFRRSSVNLVSLTTFLFPTCANIGTGIKQDSFLTITDEDDKDPFVNVVINVQAGFVTKTTEMIHKLTSSRTFEGDKKPIEAPFAERPEIPRKPKKPETPAPTNVNGNGQQNGKHSLDDLVEVEPKGVKRAREDEDVHPLKKAKLSESSGGIVVVEDGGGAIVIDD